MGTDYSAGLYLRLSRDDDKLGESASISTQRRMLAAYAKEHGYLVYAEYVDDGYSGTSFDRPGFQRMIRDIESKKINMVITKDLSRLGRDYITAGQYTELYFPSKGVRYIAVNDGYDSDSPYNDLAPFQHVINEMYARDASKKIRSALQSKIAAGCFIGNFAPYGYQKDPENKNHLLVDPSTAQVVQYIFQQAELGFRPADIARELNRRGVPCPALHRCQTHPGLDAANYSRRLEWTPSTIGKMLRNICYLGHMAQGKTSKLSFKAHATIEKPREDWVVVEHTHEPLVSREAFDLAGQRMASRTKRPAGGFHNIFSGIAKCADCGPNMSITSAHGVYRLACGAYKLRGTAGCTNHFIDYETLCRLVLEQLRKQLQLTDEQRHALLNRAMELPGRADGGRTDKRAATLKRRTAELDRVIEQLYEDNLSGKIGDERFQRLLARYEAEQKGAEAELQQIQERAEAGSPADQRDCSTLLAQWENPEALTPDLLYRLVDRVEISQGRYETGPDGRRVKRQQIKIIYRFSSAN